MISDSPAELLAPYNVSRESLAKLEAYVHLLTVWQQKINLIGPSTTTQIWTRHILDAVQIVPLLPTETRRIADLGTGAGIPGMVLALVGDLHVDLYESNGKKVAFLREVARQTKANVVIHQQRLEDLATIDHLPRVDVVTARALAPLSALLNYAMPFLAGGAIGLFHKGQDVDIELTAATKYWRFQHVRHQSVTDSRGVILEVREAVRV